MADLGCARVRDVAAELALGILTAGERADVASHLEDCVTCRDEVAAMEGVRARLLELVPGTEPPLGFDRRVLARLSGTSSRPQPRRHRLAPRRVRSQRSARRPVVTFAAGIAAAAAAFAGIAGGLGLAGSHPRSRPAPATVSLAAPFREGARTIGQVRAYGYDPPWVSMTVHDARASGPVTCELVGPGGTVVTLGTFDLVGGSGSWGAPDRAGLAGVTEARLVDSSGRVVATATFS